MPKTQNRATDRRKKTLSLDHNVLILAVLIGILAGGASCAFLFLLDFSGKVFSPSGLSFLGIPDDKHFLLLPLMPMIGGLTVGAICRFFPHAIEENGIHAVMHSIALKKSKIRKRTLISCATNSAVTIGSGGSAGRHGPVVQIGSAIGSALGQMFSYPPERLRLFVGCGAAAGIAASFNAPLFGILFSLEVILRDFRLPTFTPIAISAAFGGMVSRGMEGNHSVFQVSVHEWNNYEEIIFYILLGIVCGLVAAFFIKFYSQTEHFFQKKIPLHPALKPALGGLIVGILSITTPQILGSGYGFMQEVLDGGLFWGWALGLVLIKIFATSATLGSGGLGGILSPALFMGIMTGTVFGAGVHAMFPEFAATTYAIIGMGAVAGAVMQAPLTSIVMLIEFTGNYSLLLPILVSCTTASHTMQIFHKHSIFFQKLLSLGINIRNNPTRP